MKNKETRRAEAKKRQSEFDTLTVSQKVLKLDLKFGDSKGAKRERAKLALQSIKESEGRIAKEKKPEEKKKPYQKPKRS